MPRAHDDDTGEFVETVGLDDVLGVFEQVKGPAVLSADVSDVFGVTRETARRKLDKLYKRGSVDRRKVSRRTIYWLGDRGEDEDHVPVADRSDPEIEAPALDPEPDPSPAPTPETFEDAHSRLEADELGGEVWLYLEAEDLAPHTSHGRAAVVDVLLYLREHGESKTKELQEAVYPQYAGEWASARTMWNALDRHFKHVPGIEKGGYGTWTYAGDEAVHEALEDE